ncbi:MAG: GAF domain-containing protein [Sandaracinaceae bacterium]|nr:GAF domain-containing protein [Sandaracinaceae bacterium]
MSLEVRVHEGAEATTVERVLSLIDEAARPRPLPEVLGVLCAEVSHVVAADIASLYVRDDDALVLRANVGFPGDAIDQVRLAMGEGITGFAAECMRPVTVTAAEEDVHYKAVPGLGEEEFPVFMALPILVGRRAEAVLVLQRRRDHPFTDAEVTLATALSSTFAYALERARARQGDEAPGEDESPRHARLRGRGLAGGVALGRVETPPTFEGLAAVARKRGLVVEPDLRVERLAQAFARVERKLRRAAAGLDLDAATRARLDGLLLVFEDQVLQRLARDGALSEANPALVLREVAHAYARAPYRVASAPDEESMERSAEVETLCLQVVLDVVDQRVPSQGAALLLSDRLPALLVLTAIAHRASALAVGAFTDPAGLAAKLCRAASLPTVHGVGGLFAWARGGDRVLVDGEQGVVQINPSPAAIAEFRSRG